MLFRSGYGIGSGRFPQDGNDPYDTEAYMKAQKMAGSLSTLLRNACGNMHTVAYSQEEYARWTEGVSDVMGYLGIDYSFYR